MPASIKSRANHAMLQWARKSAGYSVEDIAELLSTKPETVAQWESGDKSPSIAMLRRIAAKYKRPLIVFYLPEPPEAFTVVRDFRILPDSKQWTCSRQLAHVIRVCQERQAWAASYLEDLESDHAANIEALNPDAKNIRAAAYMVRRQLGVGLEEQIGCASESIAFGMWRKSIERLGVFVFQTAPVDLKEMRGFALPHPVAPAVAVNSADSYTAKVFTLIHEFTHVLCGVTGVFAGIKRASPHNEIEKFCNRVAGETLVPADAFTARFASGLGDDEDRAIAEAGRKYRVSALVILKRLLETGIVDQAFVREKWARFSRAKPKVRRPDVRIPRETLALARVGDLFARLGLSAYYANKIHGGELTDLLGLKLKHLPKLESRLYAHQVQ